MQVQCCVPLRLYSTFQVGLRCAHSRGTAKCAAAVLCRHRASVGASQKLHSCMLPSIGGLQHADTV